MEPLQEWMRGDRGAIAAYAVILAALIAAVSALTVAVINAMAATRRDRTNVRRDYYRAILQPFLSRVEGDILTASALMDMLSGWPVSTDPTSGQQFKHDEFAKLTDQITSYDVASPVPRVPAIIASLKVRDKHLDECLYQLTIARIDFIQATKRFVQEQGIAVRSSISQQPRSAPPEAQTRLYAEARRFANACIALRERVEKIMLR